MTYKGFKIDFRQVGKALRYIYNGDMYADLGKVYEAIDERVKAHDESALSYQLGEVLWD